MISKDIKNRIDLRMEREIDTLENLEVGEYYLVDFKIDKRGKRRIVKLLVNDQKRNYSLEHESHSYYRNKEQLNEYLKSENYYMFRYRGMDESNNYDYDVVEINFPRSNIPKKYKTLINTILKIPFFKNFD